MMPIVEVTTHHVVTQAGVHLLLELTATSPLEGLRGLPSVLIQMESVLKRLMQYFSSSLKPQSTLPSQTCHLSMHFWLWKDKKFK